MAELRTDVKSDVCNLAGWFTFATVGITLGLDKKKIYPELDKLADKFLSKLKEYREEVV